MTSRLGAAIFLVMYEFGPYVGVAVVGYVVGGLPTGVIVSRRRFGIDVREIGSGNIGATNVTRAFGWWAGAFVFLVDFVKGLVPLLVLKGLHFYSPYLVAVGGVSLVIGHCYSPFLRLAGGKGVATSLGCVAGVVPLAALCAAITYIVLLVLTRISAIGSLAGVAALLVFIGVRPQSSEANALIVLLSGLVIIRHRANIVRLGSSLYSLRKQRRNPEKKY